MQGKPFIILFVFAFPVLSYSQRSSNKVAINTIVTAGVVAGESAARPLFQLASGISYNRWFTGIGAGLDQYRFKSIPLFADWRMYFGNKRTAFVYANGGYSFPYDNKNTVENYYKTSERFYGGLYMDAGIGYRIKLNATHRLSFSAGYSHKTINDKIGYVYPCGTPYCVEEFYTYRYNLGRVVSKLSFEWGK